MHNQGPLITIFSALHCTLVLLLLQFLSAPLQKTATWIQSPFLSFLTKHRMKNEEIHKLFSELPEEEKLIDGKQAVWRTYVLGWISRTTL